MMRLARTGLIAAAAAAAATGLGAGLAGVAGIHLDVEGGRIPASGIAFVTAVLSLVGVALAAALLRWTAHPAPMFVRVAGALTTISLVPPLVWADDAASAATLIVLHLAAAAIVIPMLARALPASADRALPRAQRA